MIKLKGKTKVGGLKVKTKKTAVSFICILITASLQINALASVLGDITGGSKIDMSDSTELYNYSYNTFSAAQSEHYVEYIPNKDIVPVIVNGDNIYGKRNISQAAEYMTENGLTPLIGINGDFFSLQTGIPMGHTIIDGELVSSDTSGQNAVGFNSDGTAFISWLEIQGKFIRKDGGEMMLDCINKWCQPNISAAYLLTDKFSSSTKTSGNCKFVIFSKVSGRLAIEDEITLLVDEIFDYDGEIKIPEDKYVLVMTNTHGDPSKLQFMSELQVGDELVLKTESVYDKDKWKDAQQGISSVGGRLIENGKVNTKFEAGTAPRTAVGVRADGTIIFYVVDGRQSNLSTGVQLKTLAQRMSELGCVEAINLDGGGSTAIAGVYPGSDALSIINSPSEGSLRKCANYIFLKDTRANKEEYYNISYNIPQSRIYLTGDTEELGEAVITDINGNKVTGDISYEIEEASQSFLSYHDGKVTMKDTGSGFVTATYKNVNKHIFYTVYDSPGEIKVSMYATPVNQLEFFVGDEGIVDLDAIGYVYGKEINGTDDSFIWSCDEGIGTIDQNGMFVAKTDAVNEGSIYVKKREATTVIPVKIQQEQIFNDMAGHWSGDYVDALYHQGIITGEEKDGLVIFRPDSNITRGELAVILSRYLKLDTENSKTADFADFHDIPLWQRPYANAVKEAGIIGGKLTDNGVIFAGGDNVTRAEAMTMIYRTLTTEKFELSSALEFTDKDDIPSYAVEAVEVMVGMGIIKGYSDGKLLPLGNVTRAECAKMVCSVMEQ